MHLGTRFLLLASCGLIAISAMTACKPRKGTPTPGGTTKSTSGGGGGGGGALASADDESDSDGEDGDRAAAPIKHASAKVDADQSAAIRAKALSQTLADPKEAAKKLGPAKAVFKRDAKGGCGEINIGGSRYKLDCQTDGYAKVASAATPLLKEEDFAMGSAAPGSAAAGSTAVKLPDVVDFRLKNLLGSVMDQGQTLSCTAVSLSAVVDHELVMQTGKPSDVSPMNVWARYAQPNFGAAIQTNEGKSIVPMTVWPYDWKLADTWDKTKPPAPALIAKVEPAAIAKVVDVVKVDFKELRGVLAQGHAVWFGLAAAHNIQKTASVKGSTAQIIPAYDWHQTPPDQQMGHALAMVGYRTFKDTGRTYYLIQNSWGTKWGEDGFAFIDQDTLEKNFMAGYSVHVEPVGAAAANKSLGVGGTAAPTKCKPGLLRMHRAANASRVVPMEARATRVRAPKPAIVKQA